MRPAIFVLYLSLFISGAEAFAQNDVSDVHQMSTTPSNARYEVVQSELAAKWTFRLDRFTGNVHQLVRTSEGGNAWESMIVQNLPKFPKPARPSIMYPKI